jgi:hypothetical protein
MAERPELYFQAMVRLSQILDRRLPEPPEFDRRRYRADVLQRLQERKEKRRVTDLSPKLSSEAALPKRGTRLFCG